MNTFANDLEYRVVAGVNDGEGIKEQARTTFVIKAKPYKTDTTFFAESAELIFLGTGCLQKEIRLQSKVG
mgnify:CR=1 FL=1